MTHNMKRRTLPRILASLIARFDGEDLELTVEAIDKVPEPLRPLYTKDEATGHFKLRVKGIEDTSGLKSALAKERDEARVARTKLQETIAKFKDIDPEKYHTLIKAIEEGDEEALIKSGKFEDVFNRRLERFKTQHTKDLETKDNEIKAEREKGGKWAGRVLENAIRMAAGKAKLHPTAIEDAVILARSFFSLDDEGNAVRLDESGKPLLGKSGQPFSPDEWLEERQKDRPHWFLEGNSGGGAGGSGKGAGGARTMKRAAFDAIKDPAEKVKAAKEFQIVD